MNNTYKNIKLALLGTVLCVGLNACSSTMDKLSRVGEAPAMAPIENPTAKADYRPVSLPMPQQRAEKRPPNSLWSTLRPAFFDDLRANDVGDILTVVIEVADTAEVQSETDTSRSANENAQLPVLLGAEAYLNDILPDGVDPANLTSLNSGSGFSGDGEIEREETVEVRIAALVTQILPNGNFVIHGSQELRINHEKRIVMIDGIIRPEDITPANTILHDQIAEARISYGGEGTVSDIQQPRYGQQVYDILFPF